MKSLSIIILFFYSSLFYPQGNSTSGVISYKESFGSAEHNLYELHFLNEISIYEQYFPSQKGQSVQTIGGFIEPEIKSIYYTNINKNELLFQEGIAFKAIVAKENQTVIDWKIAQEFKKIGNFTCQKATTTYKCNDYIAWFSSDIPVAFGPWKLHGLPGVILECYDSTKFYHIVATKVEVPTDQEKVSKKISATKLENPVSMQKYIELRSNENEDIFNFYQSISPRDSYLKVESDYTGFMREPLK